MTQARSFSLIAVLVTSLLAYGAVSPAAADQAAAAPGRHGMVNRLQERLGLTDDQARTVREVFERQAEARKQLWQTLRQAQTELRQLALNGGDEATIKGKIAEIQGLLGQSLELRVQTLREIAPILTPEQREKLATMGHGGRKHMRGPRQG